MNERASIGGNSLSNARQKELNGYMSRVHKLETQKREIAAELGGVYKSAKEAGFDTKVMRHCVKLQRMDGEQRQAFIHDIDTYMHALGILADTPLGQAAVHAKFGDESERPRHRQQPDA